MNTTSNRLSFVAAVAVVAAGSAFATTAMAHNWGEATYEYPQPVVSSVSRADVRAATQLARANGELRLNDADYYRAAPFVAQRSRADVRGEAFAAGRSGDTLTYYGEAHDQVVATRSKRGGNGLPLVAAAR